MYEHFQSDKQLEFNVESDSEVEELMEITATLVGDQGPLTEEEYSLAPGAINGLALMMFRAGRSYQEDTDEKDTVLTVHLPVKHAAKLIERLAKEEDR